MNVLGKSGKLGSITLGKSGKLGSITLGKSGKLGSIALSENRAKEAQPRHGFSVR